MSWYPAIWYIWLLLIIERFSRSHTVSCFFINEIAYKIEDQQYAAKDDRLAFPFENMVQMQCP